MNKYGVIRKMKRGSDLLNSMTDYPGVIEKYLY
jgi:hypothetical protein